MTAALFSLLPEPNQWIGLGATLLTLVMLAGLGHVRPILNDLPGASILAGWAFLTGILTLVGVLIPSSFSTVFWILATISLGILVVRMRQNTLGIRSLVPYFVLGAPLLLIITGKFPSEVDSFTHWLPNGLYIVEQDGFLRPDGPPTRSAYPGFPYNVTFLFFAASRFAGGFVENAVILFNVIWLILFAAVIGWLLRRSQAIPAGHDWKLAAFALLCATLLNPVFVRRIWLTSYPDMATSIIVLFAGLAGWLWIEALVKREQTELTKALTFAIFLALLVNIKQANLVLVVALVVSTGIVAIRDCNVPFVLYSKRLILVIGLPLLFYFCWRYYLVEVMPLRENKIQPFADWPLDRIGDLFSKMGVVVYRKPLYFALAFGFVVLSFRHWIHRPKSEFNRLAIIVGTSFIGYNMFLLLIFIAHFGGHPQSYWRFNTHLGYLIVAATIFGLGVAYRSHCDRLSERILFVLNRGAILLVITIPILQLSLANYWRYDLEIPKPFMREVGRDLAQILPRTAKVVAIVPSDQGNFTSILRYYASQGRPDLNFGAINNPSHLDSFLKTLSETPALIWAYCPRSWVAGMLGVDVPPGHSALFERTDTGWKVGRLWRPRAPDYLIKVYKQFEFSKCAEGS